MSCMWPCCNCSVMIWQLGIACPVVPNNPPSLRSLEVFVSLLSISWPELRVCFSILPSILFPLSFCSPLITHVSFLLCCSHSHSLFASRTSTCLLSSTRGFFSPSCCFSLYPFMLVEWISNNTPPHPSFISKLFIWVNSSLVGVLYLHFISFPLLFSLTSYPIPSPHCPPCPTIIITTMRCILPAPHHFCRTIRRSTWSTYTAGLTACAPRTKAPTSNSPPLPPI